MEKLTLKEKCEALRSKTDYVLPHKGYTMVMIDGHSFSKLIKNKYEKPFSKKFINYMNETAKYICKKVQGCKFAYVQSDEITFVLTDFEKEKTTPFFGNRLCKLQSIIPSMAAAKFNQLMLADEISDTIKSREEILDLTVVDFDAKAWFVDNFNDVFAYYLWRQNDCIKNSKQQAAQTYFSPKRLDGLDTDEQVELLKQKKGIDWNDYDYGEKYGRFVYKEMVEGENEYGAFMRNEWCAYGAFPLNTKEGKEKFIELGKIPVKEEN